MTIGAHETSPARAIPETTNATPAITTAATSGPRSTLASGSATEVRAFDAVAFP
jgi:hypothetical protein